MAQKTNDLDGIEWATAGILSQGWLGNQLDICAKASRVSQDTLEKLRAEQPQGGR